MEHCGIEEVRKPLRFKGQKANPASETIPTQKSNGDSITSPQIKLIRTLGKQLHQSESEVVEMIQAQFKTQVIEDLTRRQGSEVITQLKGLIQKARKGNGHGNGTDDVQPSATH